MDYGLSPSAEAPSAAEDSGRLYAVGRVCPSKARFRLAAYGRIPQQAAVCHWSIGLKPMSGKENKLIEVDLAVLIEILIKCGPIAVIQPEI